MCKLIDINDNFITIEQKNIIEKIKKKLKNNIDNPKLKIEPIFLKKKEENKENEIKLNIVQDGYLISGSKQRAAKIFIKNIIKNNNNINTLVYAGSSNGYGAVATAYSAYKLGLKSSVFLSGDINSDINTRQINTLLALNSKITFCNTFKEARYMEYKESNIPNKKWITKPNYFIVPMGLNDEKSIMINILSKQIQKASKNTILDNFKSNKFRFWLVAGSGGIVMSLFKAFPNSIFFIYLTGSGIHKKNVIKWANQHKDRVNIIKPEKYLNNSNIYKNNINKYYSSVKNYDDKIWPYIKKYAQNGDFIWNISSDKYLFL
jgi:hypothetical protein